MLADEISHYPPDPKSAARHRAELIAKTPSMRVVLVTMLENSELQTHSAPGPITVQALHGKIAFAVDSEIVELGPGEMIVVPGKVQHAVKCLADGAFLLTMANPG